MAYSREQIQHLFQSRFNQTAWTDFIINFFKAKTLRRVPEPLDIDQSEGLGYYWGKLSTSDDYEISFFYLKMNRSIDQRRVGLRQLVNRYVKIDSDAGIAVFDDGSHWRLSFITDMRGEKTSPKRYTFVFGDAEKYYHTAVDRFLELQRTGISYKNIREAFSVEALTKQFYNDLFDWYTWALDPSTGVYFPNNPNTNADDTHQLDTKLIRLITRLMFVWFIKQKNLVPANLFDQEELKLYLKNFDPMSMDSANYYQGILQNLFFATLNRPIKNITYDKDGHEIIERRGFAHLKDKPDVKSLYRYQELFKISEEQITRLFEFIPFINGGLFECLDKNKTSDGVDQAYYDDGFSRNNTIRDGHWTRRAFVPNKLFFDPEDGIISIFNRYNFTVEENSPSEQQVALDPELLGKVFENLLGAYNPETEQTARNQSGSFYTPREIVNYMVDISLQSYLGDTDEVKVLFADDFEYDEGKQEFYKEVIGKLKAIKVLDPACGSGAFPIGMLNRIVELLQNLKAPGSKYDLKLQIMENCIYGGDIQTIAAQITKLRFFISLVCDCEKSDSPDENYGIPNLPNLETHFVSCDSLIALKKPNQYNLFEQDVIALKKKLQVVRHEHFMAKTVYQKTKLRNRDKELRDELARMLTDDNIIASADAKQLVAWNPYDQNGKASFFDPEWMFGIKDGFDVVIGNPPYIQLQNNDGKLAQMYEQYGYSSFARTGDIYCLFYERGWQLLKTNGHLCYITSNKWMRSGYGEKIRNFFANKTNPMLLIDFAGVKIFESATVDTNILLFSKSNNQHETVCAITNKQDKDSVMNLSDYVEQQNNICDFSSSDSWVILSPIEQGIKRKIEAAGIPLKDWDIRINYGIKTGFNDAFIVSTEKRNEILANCKDADERKRTAELIRPILRGRDIKRCGYVWANMWLIYIPWHFPYQFDESIQGASEKAERAFKEQYSAVYSHMLKYKEPLSKRNKAETGIRYEWYAMQRWGAKYWEDFYKLKLFYADITQQLNFCICRDVMFCNNTTYFIATENELILEHLNKYLNSPLIDWYYRTLSVQLGEKAVRMFSIYVLEIPIPPIGQNDIYKAYNLSASEIAYIENMQV
jgi:type I restriction-modification system DNA methylase subunit